jgi:hypothetical protein
MAVSPDGSLLYLAGPQYQTGGEIGLLRLVVDTATNSALLTVRVRTYHAGQPYNEDDLSLRGRAWPLAASPEGSFVYPRNEAGRCVAGKFPAQWKRPTPKRVNATL